MQSSEPEFSWLKIYDGGGLLAPSGSVKKAQVGSGYLEIS